MASNSASSEASSSEYNEMSSSENTQMSSSEYNEMSNSEMSNSEPNEINSEPNEMSSSGCNEMSCSRPKQRSNSEPPMSSSGFNDMSIIKTKKKAIRRLKKKRDELIKVEYGGCEGPNAMYVMLVSSDGHEFIIKKEHALMSSTIQAMMSGPGEFHEGETNELVFSEIESLYLGMVCKYLMFKAYYKDSSVTVPEFHVPQELALELLMVSHFFNV